MQDIMNNSANPTYKPEKHDNDVQLFSRGPTLLGHENRAAAVPVSDAAQVVTQEELARLKSSKQLLELLQAKAFDVGKIKIRLDYERELKKLQIELVKMQRWVQGDLDRVSSLIL